MPLRNGDEPHLERDEAHPDGEDAHLEGEGPISKGISPIEMVTIPFGKGESPIWRGMAGNTGRNGLEGGGYDPSFSMRNDPLADTGRWWYEQTTVNVAAFAGEPAGRVFVDSEPARELRLLEDLW